MDAIKNSRIYGLYTMLYAWAAGQWEKSLLVGWFTGQKEPPARSWSLLPGYRKVFAALKLDRLLEGSIFLRPELFAAAAVVLLPLIPTMGVLALVCGAFFALALKLGVKQDMVWHSSRIHVYVILFAVIYLYATATSTAVAGSLFPGLLTALFVLFFLVLSACDFDRQRLTRLLAVMLAVGVLVSLYGFYQRVFPSRFRSVWTDTDMFSTVTFRVYSTLENPNVLGEYFLLVLPLGAALCLASKEWWKRILCGGACAVMAVCLVLTYSRGCYLGLLLAAALFLVMLDRRFLILGIIAVVLSPLYLPESVLTRFTSIGDMGDTSTSYRVYIWLGTLVMLKDYWFCGIGPGSDAFNTVYPKYAYNAITAPHSHNLFLQITCDTGVCGLLVFLMLLVSYYRMMFTAIHREGDRSVRLLEIGAVSAVTGFLVESMTDYTFYNYRVMLLFWVVLGLSVLMTRAGRPKEAAL